MRAYRRNFLAAFLVAVVITGCEDPVPPQTKKNTTPDKVAKAVKPIKQTKTDSPLPTKPHTRTVKPATRPAAQPQDVATRLDRIEQLLAKATQSTLFAEPESEKLVSHKLGPGPGAVATSAPAVAAAGTQAPAVAPTATAPAPSDYQVMPVANGGTIAGVIAFEGTARPPKVIKVEKTPEVCGKEDRELFEVTVNDGKLQDVVLVLEGVKGGKPFDSHVLLGPPPGTRAAESGGEAVTFPGTIIKPQKCIFGAFTGVIAQGSAFRFDNLDPVKHSPHTYAVKGRVRKSLHNQDLEGNGKLDLAIKLKKGYKVIKLECDQHPHMQNWFRLVDSPYYAFSTADGTFKIDQVPPGTYKLIAWHPILGEQETEVTVAANGTVDVSFQFSSKRRRS